MKTRGVVVALVVGAGLLAPTQALAAAGDLDFSFGQGGIARARIGESTDYGTGVAIAPGGGIIAVGYVGYYPEERDSFVTRFTSGGSLDRRFGNGGSVVTNVGGGDSAPWVRVLSGGPIVVAGSTGAAGSGRSRGMYVQRLRSDGTPDAAYATGGIARVMLPYPVQLTGAAIGADGSVVAAGHHVWQEDPWRSDIVVIAVDARGRRRTSFGDGGVVVLRLPGRQTQGGAIMAGPGGSVVVTGADYSAKSPPAIITRLRPSGAIDRSFGTNGFTRLGLTDIAVRPVAVSARRGGYVLLGAGSSTLSDGYSSVLEGFQSDGTVDRSFGSSGAVQFRYDSFPAGMSVQRDGKIVVAGSQSTCGIYDCIQMLVGRFTRDGRPDATFGDRGYVLTDPGFAPSRDNGLPGNSGIGGVTLQPDGRIVVTGYADVRGPSGSSGLTDLLVARYLAGSGPAGRSDRRPPRVVVHGPAGTFRTDLDVPVSWTATDDHSGVASFDVQSRAAQHDDGFGTPLRILSDTRTTSATLRGAPGTTLAIGVRATDLAGNVSKVVERYVAFPVDDASAVHSAGWLSLGDEGSYLGTVSRTVLAGEHIDLRVSARRLALLARRCVACGSVRVTLDGATLADIDLSGPDAQQVLFPVARLVPLRSGTLRVEVTSTGKLVEIDGIGVSRVAGEA